MVAIHVFLFGFLGVIGLACLVGVIAHIKDFCINDVTDAIFTSALGIFGLSMVVLMPVCIWYGLTHEVDIHMQNSEGQVIERTVNVFEYMRDGNCFSFHDDENHYCGWEVHYNYKD